MQKQKLIFRVDGDNKTGLGHITRCCALADMLKENFEISFYTRADSKSVLEDISNYSAQVIKLDNTIDYNSEAENWVNVLNGDEIVVLDGYNFNTNYQQKIKAKKCKLVCIDDIHAYHFVADVVINHAPGIDKIKYSCEPYTQLYLGADYVLLKKIFLEEAKNDSSFKHDESSIFICLGGADPDNITQEILKEVMQLFPGETINVVTGAAYLYNNELNQVVKENNRITVHMNLKPEKMLALMKKCGIAITSASTTALEYICVKGNLFLKCIADNQKEIYHSLIEKKCAFAFELIKDESHSVTNILNQHNFIDGKSNVRLLKIFNALSQNNIEFKKAEHLDVDLLFKWINDSDVRSQSLASNKISYQDHINWFTKKLTDKNCKLYFVYKNYLPVGMIRFDRTDQECTISYLVDSLYRGKNIGTEIVIKGVDFFVDANNFKGIIKAVVKSGNIPSIKIFEKAGFEKSISDDGLYVFKKLI